MADGDLIPNIYVQNMPWKLNELQGVPMFNSGFSQVTRPVEPFWTFELETTWLDREDFQIWESFLIDRRGAASTFLGWRFSRALGQVPVASDAGLAISAVSRANSTISYTGTGTWTATKGDMLSYYTAQGGYWCGQAMETKAAAGGTMSALKVWPPPFTPHASTAAPRRRFALAEFRLVLPTPEPIERHDERRVSFQAMQVIRG